MDDLIPRFKRFSVRLSGLRDTLLDISVKFMEENNDSLSLERIYLKQVLPAKENLVELYFAKKELF